MTQRTIDYKAEEVRNGRGKTASIRLSIESGGTETVVVQNNGNDKLLPIIGTSLTTPGDIHLDYYNDVTVNTSGTDLFVRNNRSGQPDSTPFTFETGGDYTVSSKNGEGYIPGGSNKNSAGVIGSEERSIVSSGDATAVEIENVTNSTITVLIQIDFIDREQELV